METLFLYRCKPFVCTGTEKGGGKTQFLKEKLSENHIHVQALKLLQLHAKVVSIAFEEKLALDSVRLKLFLTHEFPTLEEVSTTFNRINLFFKEAVNLVAVNEKLA